MVVLIAATALVGISVTVCLKKRKSKQINTLTDNVAYGVSEREMELSTNAPYNITFDNLHNNVAYGVSEKEMELSTSAPYNATFASSTLQDSTDTYDYVTITNMIRITTEADVKTIDDSMSSNPAYEMVEHYND